MGSPGYLWGHPGGRTPAGIPSPLPPGCLGVPRLAVPQLAWAWSPPSCPRGCYGLPSVAMLRLGWVQPLPAVSMGSPARRWRSWAGSGPPLPSGQAPAVSGNQPCLHQFQLLFVSQPAWPPAGRSPRSREAVSLPAGAACTPACAPGSPAAADGFGGDARLAQGGLRLQGGRSTEASHGRRAVAASFPGGLGLIFFLSR